MIIPHEARAAQNKGSSQLFTFSSTFSWSGLVRDTSKDSVLSKAPAKSRPSPNLPMHSRVWDPGFYRRTPAPKRVPLTSRILQVYFVAHSHDLPCADTAMSPFRLKREGESKGRNPYKLWTLSMPGMLEQQFPTFLSPIVTRPSLRWDPPWSDNSDKCSRASALALVSFGRMDVLSAENIL